MSAFHPIIERAFASTTQTKIISCGAFSVRLSLDDWAFNQNVLLSFVDVPLADDHPADFAAAVIGGLPLPTDLIPADPTKVMVKETEDFYILWSPLPEGVMYIYDFVSRTAVMWCTQVTMPVWLLSRPILPLIHAHASRTEWVPIHSAAVGRDGDFLLLVGASKAGKSTAALACVAAGWDYAGDDFVLINSERKTVAPLYASGRIRTSEPTNLTARLLDFVYDRTNDDNDPRLELRLDRGPLKRTIRGGSIHSILIPRRRNDPAFHPVRARAAEAFTSIVSSTRLSLLGLAAPLTRKILATASRVPSYFVDTGNDPLAIPAGLQRILENEI